MKLLLAILFVLCLAVPASAHDGLFRGRQFNRGFNAGVRQQQFRQFRLSRYSLGLPLRFGVYQYRQQIVVDPYTGQAFVLGY